MEKRDTEDFLIRMMILRNSSAFSSHLADELDPNGECPHMAENIFSQE